MTSLTELLLKRDLASIADAPTIAKSQTSANSINVRVGLKVVTPAGNLATVTEFLGANEYLLKYDFVPKWMPVPLSVQDNLDSSYVYMRKDFIENYCKEWPYAG